MKRFILPVLLILELFSSCQSYHPLNRHNYFSGRKLYNKPLNLTFPYFGDIKFKRLRSLDKNELKKVIKGYEEIDTKDLLAYGLTDLGPHYEIMLFVQDHKKFSNDSRGLQLVLEDTVNKEILFKKVGEEKVAYLLIAAVAGNKSMKSIRKDGQSLMRHLSFDTESVEDLTYSKVFEVNKDNPNYLATRKKLKEAPIPKTDDQEWMKFQFLVTINSFMGNNTEYDHLVKGFEMSRKQHLAPILDTLLLNPKIKKNSHVLEELSSLAAGTRVFMLNENHWYPKHRLFGEMLLKPLKENGYTHLALEALFKKQDLVINTRGFPSTSSGYYTREPYFGHFIRRAKEMGFEIVDYESDEKDANRELGQAQNLADLLNSNSDIKVFVYAGLDHIIEEPTKRGKTMAVNLKELTNIDPLTVNQTDVVSETKDDLIMIPFDQIQDVVKLQRRPVDFFIINNLEPSLQYILPSLDFKKVEVKNEVLEKYFDEDLLVTIYKLKEYKSLRSKAVPISSLIKRISKDQKIILTLPSGDFFIKISSSEDERVLTKEIHV